MLFPVSALLKYGIYTDQCCVVQLNWYYVHPTCTPSRAAFLTGRYSFNSGVPFAVLPGSPVGIPADVPVLAEVLAEHPSQYISHMVGKWHVSE